MTHPRWWLWLRALAVLTGAALAPVFLLVMYVTVTGLLRPSFGALVWTVPAATEGSFVLLFTINVLLLAAGKPIGVLRLTPYPFAVASVWLNTYAYRTDLPGLVGHLVVTVAFFAGLLAAEAALRRMMIPDSQVRLSRAVADARRHAIDLVRDRKGLVVWRWRVPTLLRTQILRGRLPHEVRTAVEACVKAGDSTGWQPAVREWVLRELRLRAQAEVDDRKVLAGITGAPTREQSGEPAVAPSGAVPGAPSQPPSHAPSRGGQRKARRPVGRHASDAAILDAIDAATGDGVPPTKYRVMKDYGVGEPRAGRLLDAYTARHPRIVRVK